MLPFFHTLLASFVLVACVTPFAQRPTRSAAVQVVDFRLRLDGPDDGAVSFAVAFEMPTAVASIEWELFISDVKTAGGLQRVQEKTADLRGRRVATVMSPLVFQGMPWHFGSAFVQTRIEGVLHLKDCWGTERRFSAQREVLVRGTPQL